MTSAAKLLLLAALVIGGALTLEMRAKSRARQAEAATPPEGQFIDVDGIRIHAYVTGTGPDLVLIHGASGNWRDMTFALVPALAGRYRVIVFDRPGLGWSDRLPGFTDSAFATVGETPEAQARLLQKAAASLGADRPLVLGHSYGGAVALAWAVYLPGTLAGLIDISGAAMPWPGTLDPQYRIMANPVGAALLPPLIMGLVPESYVDRAVAGVFTPEPMPAGYTDHFDPMFTLTQARFRTNAQQVNSLRAALVVQSALYPTISVPTEIVHGTDDTIVPISVHSRPLATLVPGAVLTELPGVGHMPHQTRTADVVAAIDRAAARAGLRLP